MKNTIHRSDSVERTYHMLHEIGIPIHRLGYNHTAIAVIRFSQGDMQSLTKELYPYVAAYFGYADWHAVENSIRAVIADAWKNRDPEVWRQYFLQDCKAPSNKRFIATLAQRLQKNAPPKVGRG